MAIPKIACNSKCPMCGDPGTSTCAACGDVSYCSKACQESDWRFHKHLCKTVRTLEARPNSDMRRVLLFPASGSQPSFAWVNVQERFWGQTVEFSDIAQGDLGEERIEVSCFTGAKLDHQIILCYDDNFEAKYSDLNQAIKKATDQMCEHPWKGPVVAYCGALGDGDRSKDIQDVHDMTMADYSNVVQHLIIYCNNNIKSLSMRGPKVQAVKVICDGERNANKQNDVLGPRFRAIKLPRSHPLLQAYGEVSAISQRIGMPIKTTKCKIPKGCNAANHLVAIMHNGIDPSRPNTASDAELLIGPGVAECFGWPKPYWNRGVDTVLLTSMDGHPIDVETMEAFSSFCEHVNLLITRTKEDHELITGYKCPRLTYDQVVARITAQEWKLFLAKFENDKIATLRDLHEQFGGVEDLIESMSDVSLHKFIDADGEFQSLVVPKHNQEA